MRLTGSPTSHTTALALAGAAWLIIAGVAAHRFWRREGLSPTLGAAQRRFVIILDGIVATSVLVSVGVGVISADARLARIPGAIGIVALFTGMFVRAGATDKATSRRP